jgi:hypothetical protein
VSVWSPRCLHEARKPILCTKALGRLDHQAGLTEATGTVHQAARRGSGSIPAPGQHLLGKAGRVDVINGLVFGLKQLGGREICGSFSI